ncbi:histidine--tRNA ligase [Parasporobacterium paucivorans]|uniref:Histidine--tRNA ligase n=1 Tax=Parasporobacterium paucivorans DSM 15970 TaxID=1122934 RepID=A0A1M6C529_9FIRM|nr:histidine--tRNA ligase [Parasporobacterium paucivorans]SHI56043.1 histidyl-tRNA synthetase [Parasporobacterium paucivorans DSM 15970]
MITQAPRGTQDWFGEEMHKRTAVEKICRDLARTYNIKEIITPMFEHTVLFQRSVGETTDVVQKEMYTFMDKGDRSITLKPEGTAGAIRAYIEHGMHSQPGPTKLFYVTQAFRYEKPQSGRLRQHHQFGVEFIGSKSPMVEAELISLVSTLIKRLGLKDAKLHINSIGCSKCRITYNEALLTYLNEHKDELCSTCQERMLKNPLRVIDCKAESCRKIIKDAPRTIDYLDDECREHFEELKEILTALNIPFEIDTGIVRGLDYYTKTVFEFVNKEGFTLCGGGRYDNLAFEIDGKQDIPSAGFGMGIERILFFLDQEGVQLEAEPPVQLYVGVMGKDSKIESYKLVQALREKGIIVETDYMDRSVKAQMKYANKIGALYTVVIGEDELKTNTASVKNMETGEALSLQIDKIQELF